MLFSIIGGLDMKDTALYEQLLGLKTPWSVKKVDLSLADQRVVVEVVLKKGQVWADPTDATKRAHINGWSERQWRHLRLYSSGQNNFNRDYAAEGPQSGDNAGFNVFTIANGEVHHRYGDEMGMETADPGEDPRGAPDLMPLWNILDLTPAGRGADWYPALEYAIVPEEPEHRP